MGEILLAQGRLPEARGYLARALAAETRGKALMSALVRANWVGLLLREGDREQATMRRPTRRSPRPSRLSRHSVYASTRATWEDRFRA
jgi:hypothetical protein